LPESSWNSQFEDQPVRINDYLRKVYRGRWIIIISFLIVFSATAYISYTTPPTFEASCLVIVDEEGGLDRALFGASSYGKQLTGLNNQLQILKSRQLAAKVVDNLLNSPQRDSLRLFHVEKPTEEIDYYDLGIERVLRSLAVSLVRDTDIIQIKMRAASAWEAAFLANSVARAYEELDQESSSKEITQVVEFLDDQLASKEKDLRASEEMLRRFRQTAGTFSLPGEAGLIVNQLVEFESDYQEAQTEIKTYETRLEFLKSQLGKLRETLESDLAEITQPLILELRNRIAQSEAVLATYKIQGLGVEYPQVKKEKDKLDGLKQALNDETKKILLQNMPVGDPLARNQEVLEGIIKMETEIGAYKARADALREIVLQYSLELEKLPDKTLQLARLERSRKLNENIYLMMKEKYEEARITRAGLVGKIGIVDEAIPPDFPISPKKRRNLIWGFVLGVGLGVGITFFREYMDNSVRTIEDVDRIKLPLLGSIPKIEPEEANGKWLPEFVSHFHSKNGNNWEAEDITNRLITHLRPKSPISEAYRGLRTQIQYSKTEEPARTILVSSPGPGEGKSTSVTNLAIALAQMGSKTALVDADLRRPVLHGLFGLKRETGLTNYMVGNATLSDIIKPTQVDNLYLITTGILPPNPSEMLGSARMQELVQKLKQEFDHVLLDSPPIIAVTDALVLAPWVDGIILVLRSGKTDRDAALRAFELVQNVNGRMLGTLLNDISSSSMYGSYYYYYYYHYSYSETGEKKKRKVNKRSRSKHHRRKDAIEV
jgi:tyrosine-protein kinase Etk/Wzc